MDTNIDWGQVIFLLLVVVVGFFRWLGNLLEQKKEARDRAATTPEERRLRDEAWRRQIGDPTPPAPAPQSDPFREIRDLFNELNGPEAPPPLPASPPTSPRRTAPPPLRPSAATPPPPVPPAPPLATPVLPPIPPIDSLSATGKRRTAAFRLLRKELGTQKSLRQAIVIREILGPPKALETSDQ